MTRNFIYTSNWLFKIYYWCWKLSLCTLVLNRIWDRTLGEVEKNSFIALPVNPNGNQSWIFIERSDAAAEIPKLWPPHAKNWLIGKDLDAEKDWRQGRGQQRMRQLPCPSPPPRDYSNSQQSSQWCHPILSSPVVPFSCLQSFPASGSFPMNQLFTWGGQSTGVSALASFLPKKSQGWSPSEWAGWISLQSKGLSRVFSNTEVQKHQFFTTQLSL